MPDNQIQKTDPFVDTSDRELQLVVFKLGGDSFGVEIQYIQEIIRTKNVTKVPKVKDYIEGIINLRGRIIPVIDLRKRFGIPSTSSIETRIIIVEIASLVVGMIVDGVSEVMRLSNQAIDPPSPLINSIESDFIRGVGKVDDRLIILVELLNILDSKEKDTLITLSRHSEPVATH